MSLARIIYIAVIALILLPLGSWFGWQIDAPIALLLGLLFAFTMKNPCPKFNKKHRSICSRSLLFVLVLT